MRLLAAAAAALVLGGCFSPDITEGLVCGQGEKACPPGQRCNAFGMCEDDDGVPVTDAAPPIDAAPPCWIFEVDFIDECAIRDSVSSVLLDDGQYVYDTDKRELTTPAGSVIQHPWVIDNDIVIISFDDFAIEAGSVLVVRGGLPLAIVGRDGITIAGGIEASSNANQVGAGANASRCSSQGRAGEPGDEATGNGESAGGGGGGLLGDGGDGADADLFTDGGNGGNADTPSRLRGGCPGGSGGLATDTAAGGNGGGGILLVSEKTITVSGSILASGQGGLGGGTDGGGGGGGSGGMIAFEADDLVITSTAIIVANGGAGGSGDAGLSPGSAGNGQDGQPTTAPAAGGTSADGEGPGGDGGAVSTDGLDAQDQSAAAGGGGGGGAGWIVANVPNPSPIPNATISPDLEYQ